MCELGSGASGCVYEILKKNIINTPENKYFD